MSLFQQAVFTSARTERMDGYQLVAASDGVTPEQREELTAWGPAHDSLVDPQSRLGSYNFHRLNCGPFCLSRTVPAGAEYSGRAGPRIYTTCLLASEEQLRTFSNQPFRIFDAASAAGHLRIVRRIADKLPAIQLRGRASPALAALLEPLAEPELRREVIALGQAISTGRVLVQTDESWRILIDRVFNLLPLECRAAISFSTGLTLSTQRPLHVQQAPADNMDANSTAKNLKAVLWDVHSPPDNPARGWWAMVDELLAAGNVADLIALVGQPHSEAATSTRLAATP